MGGDEQAPTSIQVQYLHINSNFYQCPYQSQTNNYEYGIQSTALTTVSVGPDIPKAPTTVSVGSEIPRVPTTVSVPSLRRKVKYENGVDMEDSNADNNEQDEDKMEESNIDHNHMYIPVCNEWDEPRGDEVRNFWIIADDLCYI